MSMIVVEHLRKEYPEITPLQDVSAEIRDGKVQLTVLPGQALALKEKK